MLLCKFCNKECKNKNSHSNHERLCPKNTNRVYVSHTLGKDGHVAWNKGLKGDPRCRREGKKGHPVSEETKKKLSEVAKQRGFGGYQPNAGISKKFYVTDSYGNQVCLQSTYEFMCFEILSQLKINWIRPKALTYDGRRYFADFYLVDFGIYLDPKNSYKAKLDQEKITKVIEQNDVKIFILQEKDLTKETIVSLCS